MSTDSNSDERPPSTTKDADKEAEVLSDKGSEKESGSGEFVVSKFLGMLTKSASCWEKCLLTK